MIGTATVTGTVTSLRQNGQQGGEGEKSQRRHDAFRPSPGAQNLEISKPWPASLGNPAPSSIQASTHDGAWRVSLSSRYHGGTIYRY